MTETVQLTPAPGRRNRWVVGPFAFTRYSKPGRRWSCDCNGQGVGNCRTPAGALAAVLRMMAQENRAAS